MRTQHSHPFAQLVYQLTTTSLRHEALPPCSSPHTLFISSHARSRHPRDLSRRILEHLHFCTRHHTLDGHRPLRINSLAGITSTALQGTRYSNGSRWFVNPSTVSSRQPASGSLFTPVHPRVCATHTHRTKINPCPLPWLIPLRSATLLALPGLTAAQLRSTP